MEKQLYLGENKETGYRLVVTTRAIKWLDPTDGSITQVPVRQISRVYSEDEGVFRKRYLVYIQYFAGRQTLSFRFPTPEQRGTLYHAINSAINALQPY